MYGKHFASTYKGSMFGAGVEVFAVWGYVIANTIQSQVELNPSYLAAVLGSTPDAIAKAIEFLASPDPHSRSKNDEGRRLVREGEFAYRVPNHETYRSIRSEDDRRAYNRMKKAEERAKKKTNVSADVNTRVNDSQAMSAHTEADTKEYISEPKKSSRQKKTLTTIPDDFTVSDSMREWFQQNCTAISLDRETSSFIERCKAKGTEYKDWEAGWRTQMMNAQKWTIERNGQPVTNGRKLGEFSR